jgi:hypothetical protein
MHIDFLVAHIPLAVLNPALRFSGITPWRITRHKASEQLRLIEGGSHERAWWLTARTSD